MRISLKTGGPYIRVENTHTKAVTNNVGEKTTKIDNT